MPYRARQSDPISYGIYMYILYILDGMISRRVSHSLQKSANVSLTLFWTRAKTPYVDSQRPKPLDTKHDPNTNLNLPPSGCWNRLFECVWFQWAALHFAYPLRLRAGAAGSSGGPVSELASNCSQRHIRNPTISQTFCPRTSISYPAWCQCGWSWSTKKWWCWSLGNANLLPWSFGQWAFCPRNVNVIPCQLVRLRWSVALLCSWLKELELK